MNARPLLLCCICTATNLLAYSCSVPSHEAHTSSPEARSFETTVTGIERSDPDSPGVLIAQVNYAEFLLSGEPSTCADRLERAQEQLGSVDASPKVRVMYPDGWATVADLEYRLHLARAACGGEADRNGELRTAVAAARRAVELYRDVFDYHSMVIMQFDAGVTLHELGEKAAAITALEAALDMDREYGFVDDAPENYKLLLSWRGEPAGDTQVAQLMQSFPRRQAIMKFGWRASDARINLESRRACLVDGQIVSSHAVAAFERHIGANNGGGWSVSYSHRLTHYEPGVWPTMQGARTPPMAFPPALLPRVGFKVSATGEFDVVTDSRAFAERLADKTEELIRAAAPSGDRAHNIMDDALETMPASLSPGMLEAAAAENYQLETAMWIGATLDQGVWYEVDAPLLLPGMPRVVAQNHMEFAFTRVLPCTADAAGQACVEIVIRAAPDKEALDRVIADLNDQPEQKRVNAYTASTEARIVTDPATLLPFASEERVYWYASLSRGQGQSKGRVDSVLQSEHLLSTVGYGTD